LTESDTLEVTTMNPKTDAEFDTPATASAKDPDGPETPNLAKPDEAPKADAEPETPGTPATTSAKDSANPKAPGRPTEAPDPEAEGENTPATASAKDPDGPEIPNLAKPDEAPKA
jgi:hypothetical protein